MDNKFKDTSNFEGSLLAKKILEQKKQEKEEKRTQKIKQNDEMAKLLLKYLVVLSIPIAVIDLWCYFFKYLF